jgi:hypothetical protein
MFWIVLVEIGVMFALLVVSWHVYLAHRPAASASAVLPPAPASSPALSPGGTQSPTPRPTTSPTPTVLRTPAAFPIDMGQLNRDQAALERSENGLLVAIVRASRDYLERVVLPAVRRAERVSSATSRATIQSPAAIRKMS